MKDSNKEKLRAFNIIWNASDDYSFKPETIAYDQNGKADLYWNYIIGAVHKYYDYSLLETFFKDLKKEKHYDLYEKLTWIGLENATYEKGEEERPVLENLRQNYARKIVQKGKNSPTEDLFHKIKIAHFQKILGQEPKLTGPALNLLKDLEFHKSMDTKQIIFQINEIIKMYFSLDPSANKTDLSKKITKNKKIIHFGNQKLPFYGNPFKKRLDIGSAEYFGGIHFEPKGQKPNKIAFHWLHFIKQRDKALRESMENLFGTSILPDPQTKALEKTLCDGHHKNCHLHFTRGEFQSNEKPTYQKKMILEQREKNKNYYLKNLAQNNNSIAKLTDRIRNTMLINSQSYPSKAKSGKLTAGKIWRALYLQDDKIFIKNLQEDMGNLTVDLLLDGSASQIYRQEKIATEGYIIAESLTRCHIPVRIYSFFNMENYTIINLFRDYKEDNKNNNIFHYYAAGYNRDGLAIRTALYKIKDSISENKILIILSDGKPNDTQSIPTDRLFTTHHEYTDAIGINDTAQEVRKGLQMGISILCVFTGRDEDLPAAKKIYGHHLAHIPSPERFADTVGVLLQNELNQL